MLGHQEPFAAEWIRRGFWRGDTIADALTRTTCRLPDKTAIVDGKHRISFAELAGRSASLARALGDLGVQPGDTVAYKLPNWTEAIVIVHAISILGAVANPILVVSGARETEFVLRESRARALFIPGKIRGTDHRTLIDSLRPRLPDLGYVVVVRDTAAPGTVDLAALEPRGLRSQTTAAPLADDDPVPTSALTPLAPAAADALALLIYTSGTTADPKGVMHTHNTLLAEARSLRTAHGLSAADTVLMPSPLTHISGIVHAILVPAVLGTTAVLMDRWQPALARRLIDRERVTYMVGAPTFVQDLCNEVTGGLDTLRLFSCGGATVTPKLMAQAEERLGCQTKRVYGSTEFPTVTATAPGVPADRRHETEGRAIGGTEIRIADDEGNKCPPGTEGEILARGPECCVGYLNREIDRASFDGAGWLRTGDLGVINESGYLRITGRKKDIIIRKGENISAREVEDLLAEHPAVDQVAVVGMPDPETGERAWALVCPTHAAAPTLADLNTFLLARGLSTRKLPERLKIVGSFPRTASGKIHKAALKASLRAIVFDAES